MPKIKSIIVIYIISLLLAIILLYFNTFFNLSNRVYDYFMQSSLQYKKANNDIVLIVVDKSTIEKFGQASFWTRSRYSSLLKKIEKQKPKLVYFDYYFSEKTLPENVDWDLLEEITKLPTKTIDFVFTEYENKLKNKRYLSSIDTDFASIIEKSGNVYLPYLYKIDENKNFTKQIQIEPIPIYRNTAKSGYVNIIPDSDGVVRKILINQNNSHSLSQLMGKDFGNEIINIPNEKNGELYINFFSEPYSKYTAIQFQNAYNNLFIDYAGNNVDLKDKIVLIGDYGEMFGDSLKTPVGGGKLMSGLEVIANEIQTIIENKYIKVIEGFNFYAILFVIFTISFSVFYLIKNYLLSTIIYLLSIVGFYFLDFYFFQKLIFIDYIGIFISITAPFLCCKGLSIFKNYKEKFRMRKFFSRYVEKSLIEEMIREEKIPNLGGEKKEITIFFSDLEGFTSHSEVLEPEQLIALLNSFFTVANKLIFDNKGTIDKYIGDAIMAFWGAPFKLKEHANYACTVAIKLQKVVKNLNIENNKIGLPSINVRIGITTGEAIVGSVGDEYYSDYTAMGDNVNLASRLEGINKYYGTNILISENTYKKLSDDFVVREIDNIKVKGKNKPVKIFELIGSNSTGFIMIKNIQELVNNHKKALNFYRKMSFDNALKYFKINSEKFEDATADIFIKRIEKLQKTKLPKDWDGVYNFTEK
ncbi:adenylate/guanylate cyclase domain-containing protein [Candidatus Gracilibacteria bacterium]|nr:adenylate/guanylate cyclase domain-containing protein [Candidatus Gracilibacteria bacterium]